MAPDLECEGSKEQLYWNESRHIRFGLRQGRSTGPAMKQLKLDEFFLRGGGENQHTRVRQGPNQVGGECL